jgi:dTDP-4-dehydrorhamnose reductase
VVIGNGLIARSLTSYANSNDVIIFASGVSNSAEINLENFLREENLILEQITHDATFVYFSTCSIFDSSLSTSAYVRHKLKMENLIERNFKKYIIIRLPTLVGNTGNPNTFFNSFVNMLQSSSPIHVYEKANRYLLDAADLPMIVNLLIQQKTNLIINVVFDNKASVSNIVNYLHRKLASKSQIIYEDKGNDFSVDNSKFKELISLNPTEMSMFSFENILDRYI